MKHVYVGWNDGYFYYVMELADPAKNPNDEIRNPKEPRNPNAETDTLFAAKRADDPGLFDNHAVPFKGFW